MPNRSHALRQTAALGLLAENAEQQRRLDAAKWSLVAGSRREGLTWREIAAALDTDASRLCRNYRAHTTSAAGATP